MFPLALGTFSGRCWLPTESKPDKEPRAKKVFSVVSQTLVPNIVLFIHKFAKNEKQKNLTYLKSTHKRCFCHVTIRAWFHVLWLYCNLSVSLYKATMRLIGKLSHMKNKCFNMPNGNKHLISTNCLVLTKELCDYSNSFQHFSDLFSSMKGTFYFVIEVHF